MRSDKGALVPLSALMTLERAQHRRWLTAITCFLLRTLWAHLPQAIPLVRHYKLWKSRCRSVSSDFHLGWVVLPCKKKLAKRRLPASFFVGFGHGLSYSLPHNMKAGLALVVSPPCLWGVGRYRPLHGYALSNDVYFQVALITLVGLAAKNAILIVEFAVEAWRDGRSLDVAAMHASRLRFRPIIMTSLAFILGCVPLAISSGAGANSRHAIGTAVIGGMLAATFIATLFVPYFFKAIMTLSLKLRGEKDPNANSKLTFKDEGDDNV